MDTDCSLWGSSSTVREVRKIAKNDYWLRHVSLFFRPSLRMKWNNAAVTVPIFMKFDISVFRKSVEKIRVSLNFDKNNEYLTWRPIYIFDRISLSSF
jgi:hypothetical protein